MSDPVHALQDRLAPIIDSVHTMPLANAEHAVQLLTERFAPSDPAMLALADTLREGVEQGWLCNRGEPSARFSRVAKAGPQTRGLSIDVVSLLGPAVRHRHPRGEITFGIPTSPADGDTARFDGHPPGWVVMEPGSVHTPTVTGSPMILMYFLPGGAVEWNPAEPAAVTPSEA